MSDEFRPTTAKEPWVLDGGTAVLANDRDEGPTFEFPSGRAIHAQSSTPHGEDRLTVRAPDGQVELSIRFTREGPVLRFESADMEIASAGTVSVDCDAYEVNARSDIRTSAGGDLVQEAAGRIRQVAQEEAVYQARSTDIQSTRGDVFVRANDNARIHGELVKLNC